MCSDASCLGFLLIAILLGFAILIYFLLNYRKKFLSQNLQLSPEQIWETVSKRAVSMGVSKSDLLHGIYQEPTSSIRQLVIKDSSSEIVACMEHALGVRGSVLVYGNEKYQIEYPLTWRRSAELKDSKGAVLASFERIPFSFRKHRFVIAGLGVLQSQNPGFNFHYPFDYSLNGKVVGIAQQISTRPIGSLVVFPSEYPLIAKLFILAINASGV